MSNELIFNKILVTGGCGFIGSNFIKFLLAHHPSYKVVNLDALTYAGNLENLVNIQNSPNYEFVKGNICDKNIVDMLMANCDAVVHFAAESHVDRSIRTAGKFIQTNVYGTYVLLQSAYENHVERTHDNGFKRFVMISTDEVYGDIPPDYSSKETDVLMPRNPYAASKAGADYLSYSFHETHELPVVITRSSNNYGPLQYPEKMLPLFITNLIENKKVPLYGDGKNIRDWLFVEDNCRAIDLVLHRGQNGEIYNIGGGNEKQNIEVTKMILDIMNRDPGWIDHVKDRKGHDRRYSLDSAKIKKELCWAPQHDFEVALRETVDWYMSNESWWKKLKI